MQYKKVSIFPWGVGRSRKWRVRFENIPGDRTDEPQEPHSLGWLYYPADSSDQEAFEKLKNFMVAQHETEVARLLQSTQKLKKLQISDLMPMASDEE